jgi:hypothetical protein
LRAEKPLWASVIPAVKAFNFTGFKDFGVNNCKPGLNAIAYFHKVLLPVIE